MEIKYISLNQLSAQEVDNCSKKKTSPSNKWHILSTIALNSLFSRDCSQRSCTKFDVITRPGKSDLSIIQRDDLNLREYVQPSMNVYVSA